ncbi:AIPR family protein [Vibrio sp.]|uniref:AIPR family protein n=1 Tax=Vibrio sp. TaxID=678 RepID=UPI003120056E
MHPILNTYVNNLTEEFQFSGLDGPKLFEAFCNYCVLSKTYLGRFNPLDVTTEEDDASIDGLAVCIDGELILTEGDAEAAFDTHKRNLEVDLIVTQVKSGDKFDKSEISSFALGLQDFLSLTPKLPNGEYNQEVLNIFKVVIGNLKKVSNNRPNCAVYYCTSGNYAAEREVDATLRILKSTVEDSDLFHEVVVHPFGRKELISTWKSINEKNEAKVKLEEYCGIPKNKDIPQSYIGIVNGRVFVESLLLDSEKNLKHSVFEENVRSFLGDDNTVNSNIANTLQSDDKRHLFSVLNNGITVVAPQLTLTANSKEMDLVNYQVINGCQTSNTLFQQLAHLDDSVNIVVRFIESPNYEISADIISATNSQTGIGQERFQGLKEKAKLVQHYFDMENSKHTGVRHNQIYFERRENEYREHSYYATQIFDVRELGRAFAAGILNDAHNASRYPKNLFKTVGEQFFKDTDSEALYYMCALTLYKFNMLSNGSKENANLYTKYKWHIIQLFMWVVHGKIADIQANSSKAQKYADKVVKALNSSDKKYTDAFVECFEIIDSVTPAPTSDQIKRSKFTADLREQAKKHFEAKKNKQAAEVV